MENKDKKIDKSDQIYVHCSLDKFMDIAEVLLKDFGFRIEIVPSDAWPIAIDFDKKVAYSINSATNAYLIQKAHGRYLTYEECFEIVKNHKRD